MKKWFLVILLILIVLSVSACSGSKANNDNAVLTITGKITRVDYTSKGARYFFDGGSWVVQPREYPGIELGCIYKISYLEGDNSITSITLVQK